MIRYMLATNICIYLVKQKPRQVLDRLTAILIEDVSISSITVAELEFGVAKSNQREQNRKALQAFLAPFSILPFEDTAARFYGALRADLEQKGTPIGNMDMLIAAHALSCKVTLVTNNTKEFDRISGLRVENWVSNL